jgi:outer membrane protein TolC
MPESLGRAIVAARDRHPNVVMARARLEASRSALVGAKLPPIGNPHVEVLAGRGDRGVTRDVELRSSVTLPVEFAGQRGRRIAEADAFVSVHSAMLSYATAIATGEAVRAWGIALGESARTAALRELNRIAEEEYRFHEARRAAGDATEQEVQLAALEVGRHQVLLAETSADLEAALGEFQRVTGAPWQETPEKLVRAPVRGMLSLPSILAREQLPSVMGLLAEATLHARTAERFERESWSPLAIIVNGGRGDFGESRIGVGAGLTLPLFRRFQGERARAQGDKNRADTEAVVTAQAVTRRLEAMRREVQQVSRALDALEQSAMPAAEAALTAAVELRRLGKSDYLTALLARREITNLTLRRVDLTEREWMILAEWVQLTGRLP